MATVVADPCALLPFHLDHDVAYCRNPDETLAALDIRRDSGQHADTLWLRWDLNIDREEQEFDASPVITALADEARAGRPYPVACIIVMTYSSERSSQAWENLGPFYEVHQISPHDTAFLYPSEPRPVPRPDLPPMERLYRAGVQVEPGLSGDEIASAQERFGVEFSPVHRDFLAAGLPVSILPTTNGWPDWRHGDPEVLAQRMLRPNLKQLNELARTPGYVPLMIPLWANKYVPAGTQYPRSPVFSAHERDIIYFGASISEWIGISFEGVAWPLVRLPHADRIPFWSEVAEPR